METLKTYINSKEITRTAKNTVISLDFLAIRPKLCGNCAVPQNFHTKKSGEITVLFAVSPINKIRRDYKTAFNFLQGNSIRHMREKLTMSVRFVLLFSIKCKESCIYNTLVKLKSAINILIKILINKKLNQRHNVFSVVLINTIFQN